MPRLEANRVQPVGDAEGHALARRIYFDLVGLPPAPEQLDEFAVAMNNNPDSAIENLVDKLLQSPHFGERWGRHWLDVVRYAESTGMERNGTFTHAWRYRDYVIDAFYADTPYDQFVHEQIAGDLLPHDSLDQRDRQLIATGMLALGPESLNETKKEKFKMDVVDEQIDVVSRAFLGLTASCARCHDHKFDPIPQSEYYSLAGIFTSTDTFYGTSKTNGNRNPGLLLAISGDKVMPEAVSGGAKGAGDETMLVMAVSEASKIADTKLRLRGEPEDYGREIPRGFLTIASLEATRKLTDQRSGRIELVDWIIRPSNPLTARVAVNRVWQHLFGRGLVTTVNNFGTNGDRPTHPLLLDHLATMFVNEGWSVKQLIRRIMTSRVYRLGCDDDPAALVADPGNELFWRMNQRRLEAEAIRDAMLFSSGQLDLKPQTGSPVQKMGEGIIGRDIKSDAGVDQHTARSVYLPIVRGGIPEMLGLFDFPEPSIIGGVRDVTTVPTQALFMMNSPQVLDCAEKPAERIAKQSDDSWQRVRAAYRLTLSREPSDVEVDRVLQFVTETQNTFTNIDKRKPTESEAIAWAGFCQTLFASSEFRYVN